MAQPTNVPLSSRKPLPKGTPVLLIGKEIVLAEDVDIPAMSDGQRVTIKYRSTETKGGWRQIQVPVDFLVEANSDEGRQIARVAPPVRRAKDAAGGTDSA